MRFSAPTRGHLARERPITGTTHQTAPKARIDNEFSANRLFVGVGLAAVAHIQTDRSSRDNRRPVRVIARGIVAVLVATAGCVVGPLAQSPVLAAGETLVTPAATRIAPSTTNAALSDDFNIAGYLAGDTLLTNISLTAPTGTTFSIPTTTGLTLGFGYSSWTGRTVISFTGSQANTNATLGVQQWIRFQGVGAPTTNEGSETDRRVVVSLTPFD